MPRSCAARWDALLVALAVVLYTQVWRIQELFPVLGVWGLPLAATLVALLVWGLDRDPRRRVGRLNHPVVWAAVGILVLVVLSIPGSLYPGYSLNFLFKDYLRSIALMLVVAASVRELSDLGRLAWLQVAGVTLFSAVIVARSQMGADGRLRDLVYYDDNDLATLIVCTLPLVLYLGRRATRVWGRVLLAAVAVLLMTTLVKTGSRGGFLGLLAVAGYVLLRFRALSGAKRVGAVALLVILLVTAANGSYFDRMQTLLHLSTDYNWSGQSESGRMEVWKRGIGYMLSHPVLGVGVRVFHVAEGTLAAQARIQEYGRGVKWSEAHNSFIQIGAELGVLALVLFVALLVGAFRTLARVRRASGEGAFLAQALTGSLVGFVVTALFLSQAYSAYLYAILGMTVGLGRLAGSLQAARPPARPLLLRSVPAPPPLPGGGP